MAGVLVNNAGSSPSFRPGLSPCTIGQYPSFPVVFMAQSKGPVLNQLDFVIEPFGQAVGVAMPNVACHRFKPPTSRPHRAFERCQRPLTRLLNEFPKRR